MQIDTSVLIAIVGCALSVATFSSGKQHRLKQRAADRAGSDGAGLHQKRCGRGDEGGCEVY